MHPMTRGVLVNDVHSRLNPTRVREVVLVASLGALVDAVRGARGRGLPVCVAGGRHAMGGQAFAEGGVLIDTRGLNRIGRLDPVASTIEVEAGIQWPALIEGLARAQQGAAEPLTIAQKQTGADRLTLGGAVAANVHGRGLAMRPIVGDVEALAIVDAEGELQAASRRANPELFRLAVGGYGLLGVVASVTLRLVPRRKLERVVSLERVDELMSAFSRRVGEGCLYGDFQFAIDESSRDFLRHGILSCYRPVSARTPLPEIPRELSRGDWRSLVELAHTDRRRAFQRYTEHYLATAGQVYWSDTHQLGVYLDDYHRKLDHRLRSRVPGSEVIGELFVPRAALPEFMAEAAAALRRRGVVVIYGTVRLIERDGESFLEWAREPYACVVFNLHTEHSRQGIAATTGAFRALIDLALRRGGSYYLTYHRWATRAQVEAAYPRMPEFLRAKADRDPRGLFQSEWYRHHVEMFGPSRANGVRERPARRYA
jgi:FAD/FMN-containing dehydrogenase